MEAPRVAIAVNPHHAFGRGVILGVKKWIVEHPQNGWRVQVLTKEANAAIVGNARGCIGLFWNRAMLQQYYDSGVRHIVNVSNSSPQPINTLPSVHVDDEAVGQMAADYLLERGFRHFTFFGNKKLRYSVQRLEGFRRVIEAAGGSLCIKFNDDHDELRDANSSLPEWARRWIASVPKPHAVVGANDFYAKAALQWAEQLELDVPQDFAVLGVDNDFVECEVFVTTLSSIELPFAQIGYTASELLQRMMSGEKVPNERTLLPPTRVVPRASSDVTITGDDNVERALRYIHDHAHEPIHVEDVLDAVPIARRRLEMRFKELRGRTLQQEIWQAHVDRARTLLLDTQLKVSVIAEMSGFVNASRLSAVFSRIVGMTPGEYRKKYSAESVGA